MDCKTAMLLHESAGSRLAELDAVEAAALEQHLADCSDCARLVRSERAADDRLAGAMRAVPLPPGLRDRLLGRVTAEAGGRRRFFGPRTGWAAAAVVFAALVGLFWQIRQPHRLDTEQLSYEMWEQTANPSAESVREWFLREKKVAVVPPPQFNYRLLSHYDLADLRGDRVPLLVFTSGSTQARVYVVSDKQFELKGLAAAGGSGCTCVVKLFNEGHDAYLILFTGDSLDPFLSKDAREAL